MNFGLKSSEVRKNKCAPGGGSYPEAFISIEKKNGEHGDEITSLVDGKGGSGIDGVARCVRWTRFIFAIESNLRVAERRVMLCSPDSIPPCFRRDGGGCLERLVCGRETASVESVLP
jgi:hypothetical protein